MKPSLSHLLSTSLLLAATSNVFAAEVVTFDTGDELATQFIVTGTALSQSVDGGLDNSGSVVYADSDVNGFATLQDHAIDTAELEGDFSIRQLIFFKTGTRESAERDRRRAVYIGLTAADSVAYEGAGFLAEGAAFASLYMTDAITGNGTLDTNLSFATSKPDEYKMTTSTTYNLQADSWYALEAVYEFPVAFETLTVTVRLHRASASGELLEELGSASSDSTEVQTLFGSSPVLKGFFGTRSAGRTNIALIDNAELLELTYVPPPPPIDDLWRSTLYPEDWTPPQQRGLNYATDMMVQDFSYAGYHRGEKAIPDVTGPVFNVVDYGADPNTEADSSAAIQAAINAAEANNGGVVYMPEGTYLLSLPEGASQILLIRKSNIVLRGAGIDRTFLWNTTTEMRGKDVINVDPSMYLNWGWNVGPSTRIAEDIPGPSQSIRVENPEYFEIGDRIIIAVQTTEAWNEEHNVPEWGTAQKRHYIRNIVDIDMEAGRLTLDVPTRYSILTRDNPFVYKPHPQIEETGLEHFSIGNTQYPVLTFGNNEYQTPGTSAFAMHGFTAIQLENAYNCWIRRVGTFRPEGNVEDIHILSNGISMNECAHVTIQECNFKYPQLGSGGGNGYMYRINGNENLVDRCIAGFGRHNFVLAGWDVSGNVMYGCFSEFTGYPGYARGSDTHIFLATSNLWDNMHMKKDFLESKYRSVDVAPGSFGTVFGNTQTHGVYWNTYGEEYMSGYPYIVRSDQYNFGYVIGTQGPADQVTTLSEDQARTLPIDFLEGIGSGTLLTPTSLYKDQFERRRLRDNFTPFYDVPESNGYKQVEGLGWLSDTNYPWVFHTELGWFYLLAPSLDSYYLYFKETGYHFTSSSLYPYFYQYADDTWLYFIGPVSGGWRLYYNFSSGEYEYQL